MEYVFGTQKDVEIIKTKGSCHSGLTGYHQIEQKYPDQTVTDSFHIVRLLNSGEDSEGNCYDWYEIDHHYRFTDKFTPAKPELETGINDTQDAICILSEDMETRLAEIEDALCEITAEEEE